MRIESDELLEEYFNDTTYKYPGVTFEQYKEICHTPWKFLKKEMENGKLGGVRFKYFGTFQVYKGRAENMLFNLKERFKNRNIEPKQYFVLKEMLETHLVNIKNET